MTMSDIKLNFRSAFSIHTGSNYSAPALMVMTQKDANHRPDSTNFRAMSLRYEGVRLHGFSQDVPGAINGLILCN